MNPPLRSTLSALVRLAFVAGALAGCQANNGPGDPRFDSNTNWLRECQTDEECGGDLVCACSICTLPCGDGGSCGEEAPVCIPNANLPATCSVEAGICSTGCASGSECPSDLACVDGACTPSGSETDTDTGARDARDDTDDAEGLDAPGDGPDAESDTAPDAEPDLVDDVDPDTAPDAEGDTAPDAADADAQQDATSVGFGCPAAGAPVRSVQKCGDGTSFAINELTDCTNGERFVREVCSFDCVETPSQQNDVCFEACESEERLCGDDFNLRRDTLYVCHPVDGVSVVEVCEGACVTPEGEEPTCE